MVVFCISGMLLSSLWAPAWKKQSINCLKFASFDKNMTRQCAFNPPEKYKVQRAEKGARNSLHLLACFLNSKIWISCELSERYANDGAWRQKGILLDNMCNLTRLQKLSTSLSFAPSPPLHADEFQCCCYHRRDVTCLKPLHSVQALPYTLLNLQPGSQISFRLPIKHHISISIPACFSQ